MTKRIFFSILIPAIMFFVIACEQPLDPVVEAVGETNEILTGNSWHLNSFIIEVKNEDIPPPLLFNSSDSLIANGRYDMDDMVLDSLDMRTYVVQFTDNRRIISEGGQIDILNDTIGKYFVQNEHAILINNSELKLKYNYQYDQNSRKMTLSVNAEEANRLISRVNSKLLNYISKDTPNKVGDKIADLLYNNESLQRIINDFLVSVISGKLESLNELDPEQGANELSIEIYNAIQSVDWHGKLTDLINTELENITNIDPDAVSEAIASEVVQYINEQLSTEAIYDLILPYMENIPANSETISEAVSTLLVNLIFNVFDEDKLQQVISNAWTHFTQLDETKVLQIADTIASTVEDLWINPQNISQLFLPFTQKIDSTPVLQLGNLAAQTTESLQVLIETINTKFPDLNLTPDYDNIESVITAAFIAAKPWIGNTGGPEQAASEIAELVVNQFLNHDFITNAFVSAIQYLQNIDPEVAGATIASWLINLGESVSDELIVYLSDLLSPILENINPEFVSFQIAMALNDFIEAHFTQESVAALIYPFLEKFSNINTELVASYLAHKILNLDVIKDNVTQENIEAILLPVLQNVQQTNVDQLSQNLISAIVNSAIFKSVVTEDRISTIISLLIYNSAWENVRVANNFEEASIVLSHE